VAWRASESGPLTRRGTRFEAAAHAGHRFLLVELVLMLAGAAAVIAFARLERRLRPPRPVRIAYAALLVIVVAGALAAVTVRFGSPVTIARKQYPRVLEAGLIIKNGNLNERLFNPSAGQRIPQWKAAWNDYAEHPWLGSGLGSYQRYWNQHSPTYWEVGNAPSLYLETLAELGPVGLGLLLVALLLPIAAAFRARRRALASAATGAYVVFLAHAGIDWDWEMPAVTLAGLLCGAALLVASRERDSGLPSAVRLRRFAALALVLAIASFAFVGLRGNRELAASESAAGRGDVAGAKAAAHAAAGWMPWSARPWQLLGQVELDQHHLVAARVALRKAAKIDAADWRTWYDLMLASTGRERRHALAEAARLNPLDPVITAFTGS
jgi:hypothetical protein